MVRPSFRVLLVRVVRVVLAVRMGLLGLVLLFSVRGGDGLFRTRWGRGLAYGV
ncbi:hypothetical protein TNCT6_28980 [Streptomyces sp. 6-11-2]|nr:hypothetical protein TNCT6_28980 [Streptomyces sp. 6-11-2]